MSARHTEALAHLIYGITESGGFIQLTGEVGTGKTTLIRSLLLQLPENSDIALVLNPQLSRAEFLAVILEELGVAPVSSPDSIKELHAALNTYLLENHSRGRRTVLIIDEAQNLAIDVLEQIRLLTNLETSQQKLLQITLIGQPELRQVLSRNDLRQLAQRITGRYHLEPLSKKETTEYIQHRIAVAGGNGAIFSPAACREAFKLSAGVPRLINVICDRALLGAYTREELVVTPALMKQAAREIYDTENSNESLWPRFQKPIIAVGLGLALLLGVWLGMQQGMSPALQDAITDEPTSAFAPASVAEQEPTSITAEIIIDAPAELVPAESVAAIMVTADLPASEAQTTEPAVVSLDSFLQTHQQATDTASAFETLFSLWGVDYSPGAGTACELAKTYRLQCMWQQGSLTQLQARNRPAILTLRDSNSAVHRVTVISLDDTSATLEIAQEQVDVPLQELTASWFGSSLLLWQPQIDAETVLRPGERNANVPWLREAMAKIQGGMPAATADPEYYDAALAEEVRTYQRENKLSVDGLVGVQTQIAINTDLQLPNTPLLLTGN